jgi:hypothetical protein
MNLPQRTVWEVAESAPGQPLPIFATSVTRTP